MFPSALEYWCREVTIVKAQFIHQRPAGRQNLSVLHGMMEP
ncbi:hypothetical protein AS9A_3518 [Hoyosella subflava DQS3-9A1]|uniref:Transposase n=1 Tax=Hoyosella subflava (strain DSM 45089 / JCM 17490 / NBRC 109087 / DQS3-9A1) TaxID=443218 RepID=F6ER80_HOYSD|nr:hypothetical protein AS9A_3518 [Hoyosella subflava DQS3-9A1]